jgi:hypothetical protein
VGLEVHIRGDSIQIFAKSVRLVHANLIDEILLAIKVTRLYDVEIRQNKPSDAQAGQGNGHGGTEAPEPGDSHRCAFDNFMNPRGVPGDQERLQFVPGRGLAPPNQAYGIARFESAVRRHDRAVQNDYVRIRLESFPDREKGRPTLEFYRALVHLYMHDHSFPSAMTTL